MGNVALMLSEFNTEGRGEFTSYTFLDIVDFCV
jgi:hypothetical protein